jgi:hypothetical protein
LCGSAYTGCDSVGSFAGKGKLAALNVLKSNEDVQQTFIDLGRDWELSQQLFNKLEKFSSRHLELKSSDISCLVQKVEISNLTSCHPAKTAC